MYFQVSPVHFKAKSAKPVKTQEEEIATLTLAPFTPTPKLSFLDVIVNTPQKITLSIANPRPCPVIVNALFDGPEDLELSLTWNEKVIEAKANTFLELLWCPISEYSARHSVRITCQKQLWNIPIGFKAIFPKNSTQKQKKKISTVLVKKTSPIVKLYSSKNSSQKVNAAHSDSKSKKRPPWKDVPNVSNSHLTSRGKENVETSELFVSPSNISFNIQTANDIRRYTYAVDQIDSIKKKLSPKLDDSLEPNSPDSPNPNRVCRSILKQVNSNGTPTFEELLREQFNHITLTPVGQVFVPKRVSTELFKKDDHENHQLENVKVVRNLLFDVKHGSNLDLDNGNISSETHVIGRLSFEYPEREIDSNTYVKHNLSSETYIKEEHNVESFNEYKNFKNFQNAESSGFSSISPISIKNNFEDPQLDAIVEEPSFNNSKELSRSKRQKRKSNSTFTYSPPKRQNLSPQTWSKSSCSYSARKSLEKTSTISSKKHESPLSTKSVSIFETKTLIIRDPFILAATTSIDPFLTNTIYLDQEWILQQELRFKRWFNMLLTPPSELNVADDGQHIDAARIWRECSKKDVALPPTKEDVCNKYHTSVKLDALRKHARSLYESEEIQYVLCKITTAIEAGKLEIRPDRNIHLDLSLQSRTISLLLSYNPLWLRIGLETIYKENIKLVSNSDVLGLSRFLHDRFFKDPQLIKKHKSVHNPKYTVNIKKYILKRYFELVYFLDNAKMKTLIAHDPCLFRRNAQIKESREMLIQFTIEAISAGVGDINKYLKYFGYAVHHKQLYIHEFDYAVTNLGGDLRDGVRLTRVMELILLRNDLTERLRVPAISRLQKIHNVKLVFQSLNEAGFNIEHDIEPFHIVDGHREKTLSFLWQIIYKFHAPLTMKTVTNIQNWWRSLPICLKRNKLRKIYDTKVEAATKIKKWFKRQVSSRKILAFSNVLRYYLHQKKRERAAIKIQSYFKMYLERHRYLKTQSLIKKLQKQCKLWLQSVVYQKRVSSAIILQKNVRMFLARSRFMELKRAVLSTEKLYIAKKLMKIEQRHFQELRSCTIVIQKRLRATLVMKEVRKNYLDLKSAVYFIQNKFRSKQLTHKAVNDYQNIRMAVLTIQHWYRGVKIMQKQKYDYLQLKKSVKIIEEHFLANREMEKAKTNYILLRNSTILIQKCFRATLAMKKERQQYLSLRAAANFVKEKYKANKIMLMHKQYFHNLKKVAIFIQRKFRANKAMKAQRTSFLLQRKSAYTIQQYFKSYLLMRTTKQKYLKMKLSAVIIQQRYRAYRIMLTTKREYQSLRKTVIFVQIKFRSNILMKKQRELYLEQKNSCILIQRYFRNYLMMKKERTHYLNLRVSVSFVQEKYRAKKTMKICREKYIRLKESVVFIQRKFRANKIMAVQRSLYVQLKHTVHFIETKYQAKSLMLKASREFQCLKKYVIFVQRKYRAKRIMQIERNSYLRQRNAAMVLQNHFRSYSMMKKDRKMYIEMKESATIIQKWYKSYKSMLLIRQFFKNLKKAVVVVQEKYRANKTMKIERHLYLQHRMAAIVIQKYFRSYLLMKRERKQYLEMRTAVCIIQEKYRANMLMKVCKNGFIALKKVTIIIQRRYRANKMMKIQRFAYLEQRKAAIHIQRTFRGYCRMKIEKACFKSSISAIKTIQRYGRGFLTRKKYAPLLTPEAREERRIKKIQEAAATKIQACWRGYSQRSKDQHALKIIRQRSMQAQNDAQVQNSLGSRSERALEILVAEDITLPLIISALSDFEYITRRSQIVCRSLGPILPEQLYLLIKSVARSLPEIEICVLSTYTLINLCKYPPTSAMTWFPEHLDSMVRIMLHWCDKEEMAFPGLCTLFWLFAHNAEYKKVILDLPNLVSQIEKIKTLILRKQKMVMRSANKLITSKFYPKRNLPLPGLRPDWGFDYTKRPRTFTNSVHAIESLIAILN